MQAMKPMLAIILPLPSRRMFDVDLFPPQIWIAYVLLVMKLN